MDFDPCNRFLQIRESNGIPIPKMGVRLGMWVFILTLSHTPFWPTFLQAFVLVASPRLGLRHNFINILTFRYEPRINNVYQVDLQPLKKDRIMCIKGLWINFYWFSHFCSFLPTFCPTQGHPTEAFDTLKHLPY
jgi:hypothetical protein